MISHRDFGSTTNSTNSPRQTMAALQAVKKFRLRESSAVLKTHSEASTQLKIPNPFLPHKNTESGRWAPARYSLRRQAELIKSAKASNTLHLLPPGPKLGIKQLATAANAQSTASPKASVSEELWAQEVEWEGELKEKEVLGSRLYANRRRMFKGHKWERTRQAREEERRKAMEHMDRRIVGFREVRLQRIQVVVMLSPWQSYRRKLPNPASVPRATSYTKLPY